MIISLHSGSSARPVSSATAPATAAMGPTPARSDASYIMVTIAGQPGRRSDRGERREEFALPVDVLPELVAQPAHDRFRLCPTGRCRPGCRGRMCPPSRGSFSTGPCLGVIAVKPLSALHRPSRTAPSGAASAARPGQSRPESTLSNQSRFSSPSGSLTAAPPVSSCP